MGTMCTEVSTRQVGLYSKHRAMCSSLHASHEPDVSVCLCGDCVYVVSVYMCLCIYHCSLCLVFLLLTVWMWVLLSGLKACNNPHQCSTRGIGQTETALDWSVSVNSITTGFKGVSVSSLVSLMSLSLISYLLSLTGTA